MSSTNPLFRLVSWFRSVCRSLCDSNPPELGLCAFFETIDDLVVVTDLRGRILQTNKAVERKLGYTWHELSKMGIDDLGLPQTQEASREMFARMMLGEQPDRILTVCGKNGELIPTQVRTSQGRWRGKECLIFLGKDMSIQQEAQQRFEQMFRKNPTAMILTTLAGKVFADANDSFLSMVGFSREEFVGKVNADFGLFYDEVQRSHFFAQLEEKGFVHNDETNMRTKDGKVLEVLASCESLLLDGKPHFLTSLVDISDRKRMERDLQEMNHDLEAQTARANAMAAKAEEASLAKSAFLSTMSHEIRTPMNGVIGMAELLLDTPLSEQQRHFAQVVRSSGSSLLALINDILDFSKIEAGKLELEKIGFDLGELVHGCGQAFEVQMNSKGIALSVSMDPDIPATLCGDPTRLRQILTNLVGNAVKFTDSGRIEIGCHPVRNQDDPYLLRFTVKDSGIGIPEDNLQGLFQKFTQVDVSTTRQFGGTGLGLAISKQLVDLMGGEIGVESEFGAGATFWFTASFEVKPIANSPDAFSESLRRFRDTMRALDRDALGARILLAEDLPVNQEVAVGLLHKLGFEAVRVCGDGKAVIRALEREMFDLVLMDMRMPEMDGLEATAIIRDRHSSVLQHWIPIVAMTANAMVEDKGLCLAAGMNDHLSKPISPELLGRMLEKWLTGDLAELKNPPDRALQPEVPAHPGDIPVFEYEKMLERVMGDELLARTVMGTFLDDMPGLVETLDKSIRDGDAQRIEMYAHSIKGAAANFSLERLSRVAKKIEEAGKLHDLDIARATLPDLDLEFLAAQSEVERMVAMESGFPL